METQRLKIPYPVLVEGKYDRLRLLSVIDAEIYTTGGFGVFKSEEKRMLFRSLARKTKIVVLTDSDGAGKVIRSHLSALIPKDRVIPLYVPQIEGKEKRKAMPSKEGFLGVEGMERELLYGLFQPLSVQTDGGAGAENPQKITKTDLYIDGMTGHDCSAETRDAFALSLGLPRGMTPNAFLAAINVLLTYEEYLSLVGREQEDPL
ncbi:MAG: DUF4093 domain-containing protein [Clostridia bacterium]|nr:DUF4093 domain-containing protein [Clostridia bacterium]